MTILCMEFDRQEFSRSLKREKKIFFFPIFPPNFSHLYFSFSHSLNSALSVLHESPTLSYTNGVLKFIKLENILRYNYEDNSMILYNT